LPTITSDRLIQLLEQFVRESNQPVDILLIGALALQAYGYHDRYTQDVDAEVSGHLDQLANFFSAQHIPADLTEDIGGWSVVAMPPGYKDRTSDLVRRDDLRIRLLSPVDFIIAKLRRGTDLDHEDAMFVAKRFGVSAMTVRDTAAAAVAASRQDTALFLFNKTVDLFCRNLVRERRTAER
jgi:hypothetical protein